ncbi:hypothetical protein AWR27_18055 [Spirosoma montaniterrae]|uniref:Uncharacterized protein n=2 Tax=Spirosoma montaniterrae TaxID=1178516 RepID=A0A1P9X099_9BACT|nr:hypothetical protein AWR27_18055 [Spirosoma montaniterrae]
MKFWFNNICPIMKRSLLIALNSVILLWVVAQTSSAQLKSAMNGNLLTLNGHPIHVNMLPLNSRGVLAWMEGDPASKPHKPLPFRVYLRRAGAVIRYGASDDTRAVYSAQLHDILPVARLGDELVLELAGTQAGQQVIHVLKLHSFNWLLPEDNC